MKKHGLGRMLNEPTFIGEVCPFCGSPSPQLSVLEAWDSGTGTPLRYTGYIECPKCHAQGPRVNANNKKDLILKVSKKWNTRKGFKK